MITLRLNSNMGLEMTCGACPTQWEYTWPDGKYLYFRYRHGRLSIEVGRNETAFWGIHHRIASVHAHIGDDLDGWMGDDEVLARIVSFLVDHRAALS